MTNPISNIEQHTIITIINIHVSTYVIKNA